MASPDTRDDADPRSRAIIEGVDPEIDCGAFPAKAVAGDPFVVEADIFADGHDALRCMLLHRTARQRKWREVEMEPLGNDRWRGSWVPEAPGRERYTLLAWVDHWGSWVRDLRKRVEAGQDVRVDLLIGAGIVDGFVQEAKGAGRRDLQGLAERLRETADAMETESGDARSRTPAADLEYDEAHDAPAARTPKPAADPTADPAADPTADPVADPTTDRAADPMTDPAAGKGAPGTASPDLVELVEDLEGDAGRPAREHDPRRFATRYAKELEVEVDRERAVCSAWYEFFPRSTGPAGEHGTFQTAADTLEYVAELGFDVVYLPPIHPVGRKKRKGKNNRPEAEPGDVGSPWAIGAREGGHTAVHPDLGTLEDFRRFRERAEELGLEVALDVAFQVAPDHPWVEAHPEWFRSRPDGSIQYAENPPKKYEDIYPIHFETEAWRELWEALKGVFDFWIEQGVKIFRVDNPHTKSLRFWAWCIPEIRRNHPDVIFLSEAFTRPRVMYHLAKLGFTQSYTYFAWRDEPRELRSYMEELTRTEVRHYFRPNFWPNTPDILTETLQHGGRGAFMMRFVLAATLTSNYGIYGPAFELLEHVPRNPGSEEYLDSEKYQLRDWNLEREDSLRHFIARINTIRTQHRALQRNDGLRFHAVDNDRLLVYSKRPAGDATRGTGSGTSGPAGPAAPGSHRGGAGADAGAKADANANGGDGMDGRDATILCVVNMDPWHRQAGWVDLDLEALGLQPDEAFQVHDLVAGARYGWHGSRNYVELDPRALPAHVFRIERLSSRTDTTPHD